MYTFTSARDLELTEEVAYDTIVVADYITIADGYLAPLSQNALYDPMGNMKDLLITEDEMTFWKDAFGRYRKSNCTKEDFAEYVKVLLMPGVIVGSAVCKKIMKEFLSNRNDFLLFLSQNKSRYNEEDRLLAHELYDSFMDIFDVGEMGCVFVPRRTRTRIRTARKSEGQPKKGMTGQI